MFRRLLCLLCVLLLIPVIPAVAEEAAAGNFSYDFDLTFHLDADTFPELIRTRAASYASLVNRLGLRGNISWSSITHSMDLDATLYYTDNQSLSYPFRIYGTKSRIFITSPLINNEVILLNMTALVEFALKAKNTLGVPLPYFALLFPYSTESAFSSVMEEWQNTIGSFSESGEVFPEQFRHMSDFWIEQLMNNTRLNWWIMALSTGSEAPVAIETELENLSNYASYVTNGEPVSVTVAPGTEIWQNAAGDTFFSRQESDGSFSMILSLPASENGYVPDLSIVRQNNGQTFSFDIAASVRRDASAVPAETSAEDVSYEKPVADESESNADYDEDYAIYPEEYEEYSENESYGGYGTYGGYRGLNASEADLPDILLDFRAGGTGLPAALPADSHFSLSLSILGAIYPNYAFRIEGETKKDGAVTLSMSKPQSGSSDPSEILRCTGTFLPAAEPKNVPDYMQKSMEGTFNVFSINEQKLPAFTKAVIPPLVRSIFSFVAAAPTAACQSFLDDLTEIGILDMLLD